MGELVPVTDLAPAAIEAELRDLSGLMGDGNSVYWRDDSVQARYRDLLDARDGPASAGEGADVSDDLAPVSLAEFNAADPGVPYLDYIKSVASAADVVLTAPEGERDSLIAAFNRLPDRVAAAMIAELTNPTGTGFGFCSEPEVRSFAANGRGGRIIRE